MDPETARAAARRKLGNTTVIREEIYRMNTVTFAEDLLRTARQAARFVAAWDQREEDVAALCKALGG